MDETNTTAAEAQDDTADETHDQAQAAERRAQAPAEAQNPEAVDQQAVEPVAAPPPPVEGSAEAKRQAQDDFAEGIIEYQGNRYRHLTDLPDNHALVIRADDRYPAKPLIIGFGD